MEHDSPKIHTLSYEAYSSYNITWQVPLAAGSTAAVVHVAFRSPLCHGMYSELQRLDQASKPQLGQTRGKGGDPTIRKPPRSLPH